jgi:hypothetical protein
MNEELKIIISAQTSDLKKNVKDAQNEVKGFKEQVKAASKEVDTKFKAAGQSIANGMKIGMAGIAAAAGALLALGAATQEYRNEQAKLVTAFQAAGGSASQAKDTYNDLYRVLGDGGQATEAANHLAKLTTNEKELSQWTTICQGVYGTFGASLPIESLTEAANETAKTGTLTGALADALNWAGVSEEAFQEKLDAANTEAEREQLIRSTLNGLYADAASKYETNNAAILAQNEAQAKLDATMASLGETVAPINTALTELANTALAAIQPYVQSFAENYLPQIKEVLTTVAEKLGEAFTWLSEHKAVLAVMAGIITGIVAAIGLYNAVAAVKAAMDAAQVTTLGALITAQLASAAATITAIAPYLLIVAAIAAVIAIIVLCVKNWDKIKEATQKAFEKMKETVQTGIDAIVGFFQKVINWIKENWQGLLLLIVNPFAGAFKLAYDNCEGFRNKVDGFISKIKTGIKNGFNAVKNNIINPIKNAYTNALQTFENIKTGVTNKINGLRDKVKEAIDKIKGFFNFKWELPKLKMPHFKATGEFSLNPPSVPTISVDWYAQGGVFDKPTLFPYGNGQIGGLGEAGAEAIVPLENNTQWLDKIAARLQGNGQPIVLQVDGKTFAEISVDAINQLTKQRGSLPLVIA